MPRFNRTIAMRAMFYSQNTSLFSALWVISLAAQLASPAIGKAAEPWADTKLPVKDGLELWLDASAQNAARKARQLPLLSPDRPGDFWLDGSGKVRHLSQRVPDARPRFRQAATSAAFRFDGKDDYLSASGIGASLSNATVFVVAAPKSHGGYFRGFVSFARAGGNDYNSGLNLDLGGTGTPRLQVVNAEGAGFHGQQNLLNDSAASNFGLWRVFTLNAGTGSNALKLFVDGQPQKARKRDAATMHMDELVVGARVYSNEAEPPFVQSHLDGEIAEVLVFSRVLKDDERQKVEKYLTDKHAALRVPVNDPGAPRSLEVVASPPAIQMLVPGFTWRELPVQIPNINNVKYRADGKLVALGYNGHIHILSDTDGDGLEDKAVAFWDKNTMRGPIGFALTPPGYKHGQGIFVPSKGKLSLIVDKDGDDRADEEIIVATGWKEITQNVDAIGCALDKDGNIYFSLGTQNYANGYLIDKDTGKAAFDIKSERGTVLKVSPDFSKREIICTGVRFLVGMAFNRHGDLFGTDQEGATWLPNGNPFDELLHIQQGRHYGFPPRHPKHLPDVVDEPSVFDYGPQHQSTCGLNFNESVNGGPTFGPAYWAGDALVAGESRGKLYRTKLVKTAAGYVAQNHLIGCVAALTTDVCVTPRGELVVSTHSGKPDWGTGPQGIGRLYQIAYTHTNAPQPVLTWSASPTEIRIAFDRALNPANLKNLTKETKITQGKYVMPGDRFEAMWPGYQVVHDQKAAPRYNVPVLSANVTPDNRTIILTTPPRTAAVNYAIELPDVSGSAGLRPGENSPNAKRAGSETGAPRHSQIELLADLNGVQAEWKSTDGKETWQGWLPHVDLAVSREFTQGSAEHERLWELLKKPGQLALRGQLDLAKMLQPEVQPGAKLDYEYSGEQVTLVFTSSHRGKDALPNILTKAGVINRPSQGSVHGLGVQFNSVHSLEMQFKNAGQSWERYDTLLDTGDLNVVSRIDWEMAADRHARPLPLRRFFLPFATPSADPIKLAVDRQIPELAGGNWLRGRRVFFSEQSGCAKCHQFGGLGGRLGPDLSNLLHRDYASVMKDIREPSAAINPDHTAFNLELTDGESLSGVLLADAGGTLTLGDATGRALKVDRKTVKSVKPATLSLMPEGLDKALGEAAMRDLLTFLMYPPPLEPGPIEGRTEPPPPRKRAEVEALLGAGGLQPPSGRIASNAVSEGRRQDVAGTSRPMHVVLCDGPKDHGLGEHDYPLWKRRWSKLLSLADGVSVDTAHIWPSKEQFAKADVIAFFNNNPGWNEERGRELDAHLARGGGAIYFHWAVEARGDAEAFARRIGLASNSSLLKYRHGPIDFVMHEHPLAPGFTNAHFTKEKFIDETYWQFRGNPGDVQLLASSMEDGEARPQMWTRQMGKGRIFVAIPGHYNWTFDDPVFRVLALRGLCWAAGQPMDRLVELAPVGARLVE
jgi:putative heme-binding domain-containing protein